MTFNNENWRSSRLSELCEFQGGGTPSTKVPSFWCGNIPWVSSADIGENIWEIKKQRFITNDAVLKSATKINKKGSILVVTRVGVGKIAIADENICTSQDFTNLFTKEIDVVFLTYLLKKRISVLSSQTQGTSIKGITTKELKDLQIKYPSKRTQEKIAYFMKAIDERIETQNKIIEDLKTLRKGIIDSFFRISTDEKELSLFLEERKIYSEKGEGFEHVTLSKEGICPKTERYDRDFLVTSEDKNYKITKFNDICYNPANLKFGVICLNTYGDAIFSPIYVTFEVKNIDPYYLSLFLTSSRFLKKALRYQQGTVYERMAVNPEDFCKCKVPISDPSKIERITKIVSLIDSKIIVEEKLLSTYKTQKNYLLLNMFI